METLFAVIFFLSFLAFVVGMFTPKNVGFKSRGKVALVYLGVSFVSMILGASFSEDTPQTETVTPQTEQISYAETETTVNAQPIETSQQEPEEVESSIGKPVEVGHFTYTVQSISFRKSVGDEFFGETADGIYMLVNLTIKNVSDETRTLDGSLFSVTDKDGVKYEYSTDALPHWNYPVRKLYS